MGAEYHGRSIRRVLVYRLGSLGDALIALPAFHLVRQRFPDAHITLLTNQPASGKAIAMQSLLANTGLIDHAISYPASTRSLKALLQLRAQIAEGKYDLLAYLAKPKGGWLSLWKDRLFFRSGGIRTLVGLPRTESGLRRCQLPGSDRWRWDAERIMECLTDLGTVDLADPRWWDLKFTREELAETGQLLTRNSITGSFIVASIGTKVPVNDWGEANWSSLIGRLAKTHGHLTMVMVGAPDEADYSAKLLRCWSGPSANLCGQTSPRQLGALMQRATLFIGHDSGPMHMAATVGTPCVAIFSARNVPGEWFPRPGPHTILYHQTDCFACGLTVCAGQGKKCIMSITVDEVLEAVVRRLATSSNGAAVTK